MIIRPATADDLDDCVEIGEKFWNVTEFKKWMPYPENGVRGLCENLIDINMMIVAYDDGEMVAVAGGVVGPWPFNPEINAGAELFWYVNPEHRDSGIGKEMLTGLEALARGAGAKIWSMICMDAVEPEKAEKMYLNAGYIPAERTFTKVL